MNWLRSFTRTSKNYFNISPPYKGGARGGYKRIIFRSPVKMYFALSAIILIAVAYYFHSKRQIRKNDIADMFMGTEFPASAIELEFLKTVDPNTGNVPANGVWKALQKLQEERRIFPSTFYKNYKTYPLAWYPINDFFANLAVTKITYDPNNTQVFYFCTGEGWFGGSMVQGAGIWKSTDEGASWQQLESTDTSLFYYCQDMLAHPVNSYIYVATREGGLQRSKDGGNTWQKVLGAGSGSLTNRIADIEITQNGGIFISAGIFNTDGIYYSDNGDSGTWVKQTNGFPTTGIGRIELATAPSNDSVAYAIGHSLIDDSIYGTFKTTDKGNTWIQIPNPGGNRNFARVQPWFNLILQVAPDDENVVAAGGLNIWRTTNGGNTWQQLTRNKPDTTNFQYVHVDQHEIVFISPDTVLFGNDGGIYKCDNFTDSIPILYNRNTQYNVTQFYATSIGSEAGSNLIIGGTQDNFSIIGTESGISKYEELIFGDGGFCAINYLNNNILYVTKQQNATFRFNNWANKDFDTLTNRYLSDDDVLFINPMAMDPNDPEFIYMASNKGLWRLDSASHPNTNKFSWEKATKAWGTISSIGISTIPSNIVFIGRTSGGSIYRVEEAHLSDENYTPINSGKPGTLPSGVYSSCIYVNPQNANHVISVFSNYGIESVFETKDALSSDPEWISVEGNLPDIPIRWALLHPDNDAVCYLATELGVFYTELLDGSSTNWQPMNNGLANVSTHMLRLRKSDNTVIAATHGRGVFTGVLPGEPGKYSFSWTERGPNNIGGRTRTLLVDPNDQSHKTIWAGSVSGGLWKTNNIDSIEHFVEESIVAKPAGLYVYPNPVSLEEKITIEYSLETTSNISLQIFDLSGKVISGFVNEPISAGQYKIEWATSNQLMDGIYLVVLKTDTQQYIQKVLITD